MERWVVNASPLICLAKAGFSDLLLKLPDEIIIPSAVMEEIQAGQSGDPAQAALAFGKFPVREVPVKPEILAWDLGKGESAVLSYALSNPGSSRPAMPEWVLSRSLQKMRLIKFRDCR